MAYVTINAPVIIDADELWSRIWGAEPQSFGSWWRYIDHGDGDWDKASPTTVVLEDPDDEEAAFTRTITVELIALALSEPSFPAHLRQDILDDNADCISADAVIQHIVYGEIIFG